MKYIKNNLKLYIGLYLLCILPYIKKISPIVNPNKI